MRSVRGTARLLAGEYAAFEPAVSVVAAGQFVNGFGGVVYPAALDFVEPVGLPFSPIGAG